jgi:endonuclease/exonuclease/phosphatase family metal-dependent hydrolase
VRVASWNVLHGASLDDDRVDIERLARACVTLDADVLALQEVDRAQPRSGRLDQTAEIAAALRAAAWRFEPALVGEPGSWREADATVPPDVPCYGVALVSRLPVLAWHRVPLAASRMRWPMWATGSKRVRLLPDQPRVGVVAELDAPDGPLTAIATHLSFVPGWNAVQLRRLLRAVHDLGLGDRPCVLLGDLNLPAPLPSRVSGWSSLVTANTFPAPRPRIQIDHVLARGPVGRVRAASAPRLPVSDHCAVVVDLV